MARWEEKKAKSCLLTTGCYDTGSLYHTTSFRLYQPALPSACRFDTSTSEATRSKSFPYLYDIPHIPLFCLTNVWSSLT